MLQILFIISLSSQHIFFSPLSVYTWRICFPGDSWALGPTAWRLPLESRQAMSANMGQSSCSFSRTIISTAGLDRKLLPLDPISRQLGLCFSPRCFWAGFCLSHSKNNTGSTHYCVLLWLGMRKENTHSAYTSASDQERLWWRFSVGFCFSKTLTWICTSSSNHLPGAKNQSSFLGGVSIMDILIFQYCSSTRFF